MAIFTSCTTRKQRRERRAEKKILRAKELAPFRFGKDTVVVYDTVIIERFTADTITSIVYHDTTVIINNDRVVARYFYDTTHREIHHEIQCKEITQPIQTRVVVEQFEWLSFWERNSGKWNFYILIGCVSLLLWRLISKK